MRRSHGRTSAQPDPYLYEHPPRFRHPPEAESLCPAAAKPDHPAGRADLGGGADRGDAAGRGAGLLRAVPARRGAVDSEFHGVCGELRGGVVLLPAAAAPRADGAPDGAAAGTRGAEAARGFALGGGAREHAGRGVRFGAVSQAAAAGRFPPDAGHRGGIAAAGGANQALHPGRGGHRGGGGGADVSEPDAAEHAAAAGVCAGGQCGARFQYADYRGGAGGRRSRGGAGRCGEPENPAGRRGGGQGQSGGGAGGRGPRDFRDEAGGEKRVHRHDQGRPRQCDLPRAGGRRAHALLRAVGGGAADRDRV